MPGLVATATVIVFSPLAATGLIASRPVCIARAVGRIRVCERIEQRDAGVLIPNTGTALRIRAVLHRNIARDRRIALRRRTVALVAEDGMFVLAELH
jgi:hypothetical protein